MLKPTRSKHLETIHTPTDHCSTRIVISDTCVTWWDTNATCGSHIFISLCRSWSEIRRGECSQHKWTVFITSYDSPLINKMHNDPAKIASICSNANAMVALVHSSRRLFWAPVNRQDVKHFGASQHPPVTLLAANSHIRDIMDALAGLSSNEQNPAIACALTIEYCEGKVEIVHQ
jgi:hypothetical protein